MTSVAEQGPSDGGTSTDGSTTSISEAESDGGPDTAFDDSSDSGATPVGLCGTPEADPVGVVLLERTATLLLGDGSSTPLPIGDESVPLDAYVTFRIATNGDAIAVALTWTLVDEGLHYGMELHVFDSAGAMLWHRSEPGGSLSSLTMGSDGSLVGVLQSEVRNHEGVLYTGPEEPVRYAEFHPEGPLDGQGWMPVRRVLEPNLGDLGWLEVSTETFQPLSLELDTTWHTRRGDGFVYRSGGDLVVESRSSLERFGLGALQSANVVGGGSGEWILLHDVDSELWGRVNLDSQFVEVLDLNPPRGIEHLECYMVTPALDAEGMVLVPTRDAVAGQILRLNPSEATWRAMGEPVTAIDDMHASVAGQTVLITTDPQGSTFCQPQLFDPVRGLLEGQQNQILLPEDGISHLLPSQSWVHLRADGLCAVYANGTDPTTLLDVLTGAEHELDPAASVSFVP